MALTDSDERTTEKELRKAREKSFRPRFNTRGLDAANLKDTLKNVRVTGIRHDNKKNRPDPRW
jgi:hypothetical protein